MHLKVAIYTFLLISCFGLEFSSAAFSSITTTNFLTDPETLVSSNNNFVLGFFSPRNTTNRYLGIWFNKTDSDGNLEILWVANRDNPLEGSSGVVEISDDQNLKLVDSRKSIIWSSNISFKVTDSIAQLDNTGNLILVPNGSSDSPTWQSFDNPTDSILPGGKLTLTKSINDNKFRSWNSSTDPSGGKYRFVSLPRSLPEFFIVEVATEKIYWRTGPWNGYLFLGVPNFRSQAYFGFSVDDHDGKTELSYKVDDPSLLVRFVLDYDGSLRRRYWDVDNKTWEVTWESLSSECDVYGKCGKFAACNPMKAPVCECLTGFEPEKVDEWKNGNWSNGCVRRTPLQCGVSGGKDDKFLQLTQMKVPDHAAYYQPGGDLSTVCKSMCSVNCSCLAYSSYDGIGCMFWNVSMVDIQQFFDEGNGADLFIRLAYSELPDSPDESGKRKIIIAVIVIASIFVCGILMFFMWRLITQKNGRNVARTGPKEKGWDDFPGGRDRSGEFHDLPLFEFTKLQAATDNFSIANKLGQGGFGPVYKGIFKDGQEIAVKRLSRVSGQGAQEFMNEVVVISKLQHKNLVRLLGCCIDREEKLLVYELLPNKSLDAILFDDVQCKRLDWPKRFEIIQGICRGLLYLHRDSRLRIIHRDLKPSNILLDEELNPKISDFGTARIFGTKQDQAETLRVVGTYGYMSPEYAMEGRFSEKSDVYSLGVLLIEIASGRRNNFQENVSLSLLAYAWNLWIDNDLISLVDPAVVQPSFEGQILKCIQVGLLCVQEYAKDRPNVSELISMLEVDDVKNLPCPKKPGFARAEDGSTNVTLPMRPEHYSENGVSLTALSAR